MCSIRAIVDTTCQVTLISGGQRTEVTDPYTTVRVFVGPDPEHRTYVGHLVMPLGNARELARRLNGPAQ